MAGTTIARDREECFQSVQRLIVNPDKSTYTVRSNGQSSTGPSATDLLDQLIPLADAGYADAISFSVDIPMRYARFFATLVDGRKVTLRNSRLFVGWSGWSGRRAYLFRQNDYYLEVLVDPTDPVGQSAPANIYAVTLDSALGTRDLPRNGRSTDVRKFIAIDGGQILLFDQD